MRLLFGMFDALRPKVYRDGFIEYPETGYKRSLFCDTMTTKIQGKPISMWPIISHTPCDKYNVQRMKHLHNKPNTHKILCFAEHPAFSLKLWVNVIDTLGPSSLQLNMAESFLTKIDGKLIDIKPISVHANLQDLEINFHNYFDEDSAIKKDVNANVPAAKRPKHDIHTEQMEFPVIQPHRRRSAYEIPVEVHAKLLLDAFVAYTKISHTKKALECFRSFATATPNDSLNGSIAKSPPQNELADQHMTNKSLATFLGKTFMERIRDAKNEAATADVAINPKKKRVKYPIQIRSDLSRCREDVKYFELIVKGMPNLRKLFADTFDKLD